jgi:hypothetical protein
MTFCRLSGGPMTLNELGGHFSARPDEFLVRDALHQPWLPEELQHRAAHLVDLACGSHVDAGDWHRLAEEIAPLMAGSDANGNAWQLAALSWQLGMTLADVETLGADDLNILRDCAGSLSPMARGQIGRSPMSVITGSSCSRR